jgi:hypothetical protein
MKKKILAASVAAVMMGSTGLATAAINLTDRGQMLLGPVYVGDGGHSTEITIWNTSNVHAVKAKAVFRSHCDSAEVIDFIIYLSPADAWRGTIISDGTKARLVTSDDSTKIEADVGQPSAWNDVTPANFPLYTDKLATNTTSNCADDTNDFGHFEVYGVYAVDGTDGSDTYVVNGTSVKVDRGMSKSDLALIMDLPEANFGDRTGGARADNTVNSGDVEGFEGVYSIAPAMLNIAGREDIVATSGERSSLNLTALAASVDGPLDVTAVPGTVALDAMNYVVSEATYDAFIAADTTIGDSMGYNSAATSAGADPLDGRYILAGDNLGLIEAALARSAQSFGYENVAGTDATGLLVTAPTRYRHIEATDTETFCDSTTNASSDQYSAPFNLNDGNILYAATFYDNSENIPGTPAGGATSGGVEEIINLTIPDETTYFIPGYPTEAGFDSGWAHMTFTQQNTAGCAAYAGMPLLSSTLRYEVQGGAAVNYEFNNTVPEKPSVVPVP